MPGTYPRTTNPNFKLGPKKWISVKQDIDCLKSMSNSFGGRLILQSFVFEDAGFHRSKDPRDHLTIKSATDVTLKGGKVKAGTACHVYADGTVFEMKWPRGKSDEYKFSFNKRDTSRKSDGSLDKFTLDGPLLEWLKVDGKVLGMDAINNIQKLKKTGQNKLLKNVRDELKVLLSNNGID